MSVFKPGEALSSVDLAKRVIYLGLGALFSWVMRRRGSRARRTLPSGTYSQ
ncbi:hypothetical protein [Vulcanisaeta distributa]|uniref:hypothetical protein n=1 Tax=Vulcanisaeta distributa TaxID=164451 RepID=UPI000B2A48F6|nr:hypothetical protein [Vulcanisaeta distributa]